MNKVQPKLETHVSLRRRRDESPFGFTLVEVLVVITIITLLISILIPALGRARETSRRAVCMGNLHQYGIAVTAYALDFNGWFAPNTCGRPFVVSFDTYTLYGLPSSISGCPSSAGKVYSSVSFPGIPAGETYSPWVVDLSIPGVTNYWTTYSRFAGWNPDPSSYAGVAATFNWPTIGNVPLLNGSDIVRQSETQLAADWGEYDLAYPGDPQISGNHLPRDTRESIAGDPGFIEGPLEGQNELYADGHVAWVRPDQTTARVVQADQDTFLLR